jgi:hypothetical protein
MCCGTFTLKTRLNTNVRVRNALSCRKPETNKLSVMRIVGNKLIAQPHFMPSAAALAQAAIHQATGMALMPVLT